MGTVGILELRNRMRSKTTNIFVRSIFASIAVRSLPQVSDHAIDWERYIENRKSAVRCKVEHAFKIIKDIFGFRKVRYRGLAKNFNKLNVLFACANLLMVKRGQIKSQKALIRG
ncbi:MAG: transposase [Ruminococcus sp.]